VVRIGHTPGFFLCWVEPTLYFQTCPNAALVLLGTNNTKMIFRQAAYLTVSLFYQGRKQATDWHCDFIESSAKNNENIREIFETVIKKIDKDLGVSHDNKEGKCSLM
jgi:hypothetical protein